MRVPCSNPLAVRINHLQGERLRAADLEDGLGVESWLRRLHMVGLHDTWGIALGLDVTADAGAGRGVLVRPGLAYDARGRPLLISAPAVAPNPWASYPAADPTAAFDLVLIADAERDRTPADRDDGLCLSCAEAPVRDRPALLWRPAGRARIGIEVELVRATRVDPKTPTKPGDPPPLLAFDFTIRRLAETQARPHLAGGVTPPDQPWHAWRPSTQREKIFGLETVVDVSDWGFSAAPTFLASLAVDTTSAAGLAFFTRLAALDELILTHVAPDPTAPARRFLFRVIPPDVRLLDPATAPDGRVVVGPSYRSPLRVDWVGIEPAGGCPPGDAEVLGRTVRCCRPEVAS